MAPEPLSPTGRPRTSVLLDRALAAACLPDAAGRGAPRALRWSGYADGEQPAPHQPRRGSASVASPESASRSDADLEFIQATIARSLRRFDKGGQKRSDPVTPQVSARCRSRRVRADLPEI